jgi:hypothetical protein
MERSLIVPRTCERCLCIHLRADLAAGMCSALIPAQAREVPGPPPQPLLRERGGWATSFEGLVMGAVLLGGVVAFGAIIWLVTRG